MAEITLPADSSTLVLNGTVIDDFVDGDTITMTPVNPLTAHTRSSKGVNIQGRSDGHVYDLVFRVPKYSDSDIFMLSNMNSDMPVVFNGTLKENYNRDGAATVTTYSLESASITTLPTDTRNNQDGNNTMEYTLRVNRAMRK